MVITVLLVIGGALAGVIYWAYTGPRDLSAYTADIEESINETLKGDRVKIGSAKLAYGGLEQPIYVAATNVVITGSKNTEVAHLREMQLTYGFIKLLTGNFVPSELRLVGFDVDTTDFFESKKDSSFDLKDFDLSELRLIELKRGKMKVSKLGEEWDVQSLKLKFRHRKLTIEGIINPSATEKINLTGRGSYSKNFYEITAKVNNLDTKRFGLFAPEVAGANLTINGSATVRVGSGKLESVAANIISMKGELKNTKLRDKWIINKGTLVGSYSFPTKDAVIDGANLEFADGTKIAGRAKISGQGDIKAEGALERLPIEILHRYWPVDVANNALSWADAHFKKGIIHKATAKIDIKGADVKAGTIPLNAVDLNYEVTGMDVNYADDLLPIINAAGVAHMDANSLRIKVASATLGTSAISNTKVDLTEIGTGKQEMLAINGILTGSVRDIADFYIKINKRRSKDVLLASTQDVNGNAVTKIGIKLPLKAALTFDEIGVDVNSQISSGTIKSEKFSAKDGNISLEVNDKGYAVKGAASATFGGKDKDYNFIDVPLKLDFSKFTTQKIALDADITNSDITIKQLGATKRKGEKGQAELMITGTEITKLVVDSPSIKITGSGTLNLAMDDIKTLKLTSFEGGGSKFTADIEKNNGYTINFDAETLNVAPVLDSISKPNSGAAQDPTKIALSGKAKKLLLRQNQSIDNATIKISCVADCNYVDLDSKDIKISQTPAKISITAGDAGKILKMLDVYNDMDGGKMVVDAKGNSKGEYDGNVLIENFTIQHARVLTKILTLGSLSGIADALQGNGISFKKLKTKFNRTADEIKISKFRMFGSAIGLTTDGKVNRKTGEIEFQGKIIPAYTANTLLGKIPVLGNIIIGDEGVFAFAYSVKGKMEDPDVFVNPLSVLAPGFLQEIFQQ